MYNDKNISVQDFLDFFFPNCFSKTFQDLLYEGICHGNDLDLCQGRGACPDVEPVDTDCYGSTEHLGQPVCL